MGNIHERYEILYQIKASAGDSRIAVGQKGLCRYCGKGGAASFRKIAHTFPESLGNKWGVSLDECDDCNALFSLYEDAVAKAVSPFLTIGGTRGKGNRVRQTGRSAGNSVITHSHSERRQLSFQIRDAEFSDVVRVDMQSQQLILRVPVAGVPFVPRYAFKALSKIAFSLLPPDEIQHYQKLQRWLLEPSDMLEFPRLEVGASFGFVGNAPPLVVGTLLRRRDPSDGVPYILFIFSAGSICLQIELLSDHLEDHIPPVANGNIKIRWSNVLATLGYEPIRIDYGDPVHFNWASTVSEAQPVEALEITISPDATTGHITPIFRPATLSSLHK